MPANNLREETINHHRGCRGKAHASGIAKQNAREKASNPRSSLSSTGSSSINLKNSKITRKDSGSRNSSTRCQDDTNVRRKMSRNSTSSWEYSDSDSINSSETGNVNDSLRDSANSMIRRIDLVLDDIDDEKEMFRVNDGLGNSGESQKRDSRNFRSTRSFRSAVTPHEIVRDTSKRFLKRESWADSLRSSPRITDERYRKMEQGWDDSSVIKVPKERKWQRITAKKEERIEATDEHDNCDSTRLNVDGRRIHFVNERKGQGSGRIIKRTRYGQQSRRPVYEVVEWEELLEMAMNRKFNRLGKNKQGEQFLKNLDILLESRAPQNVQVLFPRNH